MINNDRIMINKRFNKKYEKYERKTYIESEIDKI